MHVNHWEYSCANECSNRPTTGTLKQNLVHDTRADKCKSEHTVHHASRWPKRVQTEIQARILPPANLRPNKVRNSFAIHKQSAQLKQKHMRSPADGQHSYSAYCTEPSSCMLHKEALQAPRL